MSGEWQLKELDTVDDLIVAVYKKLTGRDNRVLPIKPVAAKRVCIVRYGAIGDALQLTPLIHQLHDDGYEVTLNISPYTVDIYRNNPYVHNIIIQERSVIPNQDLGPYWDFWRSQYDRYINLSESIEGKLLKVEGRDEFYTPKAWRHKVGNVNYHDQHMRLGGYDSTQYHLPELYFTRSEEKEINYELRLLEGNFVVAWGLKGSSHHKSYPYYKEVASEWLATHPDSYILQIGGAESTGLEIDHPRAVPLSGKWSLRKSLLCTKYVDVVIGPESALINAASCFTTPKICMLSHSTPYNLTHYWKNVIALTPDVEMAPCYPCHQLHYNLESCPTVNVEIGERIISNLPACTTAIRPEIVFDALEDVYQLWSERRLTTGN
jgi:ADP-heptose:LPS heptosyltransferase